jgi:dCMP deaminase
MRFDNKRWLSKLETFQRFAVDLANLSTCKRAKVGCVIVPIDFSSVVSIGYNGVPHGVDNSACTAEAGQCGCIHAEQNAIAKNVNLKDPLYLISTTCPCYTCALMILAVPNITKVFYTTQYRDTRGLELLHGKAIKI